MYQSTKTIKLQRNIIKKGIKVTFKDGQITEVSVLKKRQSNEDLVFENNGARGF